MKGAVQCSKNYSKPFCNISIPADSLQNENAKRNIALNSNTYIKKLHELTDYSTDQLQQMGYSEGNIAIINKLRLNEIIYRLMKN